MQADVMTDAGGHICGLALRANACALGQASAAILRQNADGLNLSMLNELRDGIAQALAPEALRKPDEITLPFEGEWIGAGSAFGAYAGQLAAAFTGAMQRIDAAALPQPEALLQLAAYGFNSGLARAPEQIEPAYLRDKVALTLVERAGA